MTLSLKELKKLLLLSNSTLSALPLQDEEFKTIDEDQPTAPSAPMENQMTKGTVIINYFFII